MLYVEIHRHRYWRPIIHLRAGDPVGSISHMAPGGRQIYVFCTDPGQSLISRTDKDFEIGSGRLVDFEALEPVATLLDGDECGFWWRSPRMVEPIELRFRHRDE